MSRRSVALASCVDLKGMAGFGAAAALGCALLLAAALPAGAVAAQCPNEALRAGPSAALPDCRAYELVSPLDKNGGDIRALIPPAGGLPTSYKQSSPGGERVTYTSATAFAGAVAGHYANQYLSVRGAGGWSTRGISQPRGTVLFEGKETIPALSWDPTNLFDAFSSDLCSGWVRDTNVEPLTADGLVGHVNLYRRSNCGGEGFEALSNNGPGPATIYLNDAGEPGSEIAATGPGLRFQGAAEDLSHQLFLSGAPLLPEEIGSQARCMTVTTGGEASYRWLRDGVPIAGESAPTYTFTTADEGAAVQCQITLTNTTEDAGGGFTGTTQAANKAFVAGFFPATPAPVAPGEIRFPGGGGRLGVGGAGGKTISCDPNASEWSGSPSFSYRWYRNGVEIPGATEPEYTLSAEDLATPAVFQCAVTGANAGGSVVKVSRNRETDPAPSPRVPGGNQRFSPKNVTMNKTRLYDLHEGRLELVGVLPDGSPNPESSVAGTLGGATRQSLLEHAVSEDGSRVFWTSVSGPSAGGPGQIYVRIDGERTVAVSKEAEEARGASESLFWQGAADGSAALFSTGTFTLVGNRPANAGLYEFDVDTQTTRRIAERIEGVLGASEDLSRVYFVSTEALAAGAVEGKWNLYLEEEGEKRLVAILSADDEEVHSVGVSPIRPEPIRRASRVTPDGRHVAFQSVTPLSGYENADPESGKRFTEVYRYDAVADELACVSCNPSGAPPSGPPILLPYGSQPLTPSASFNERFGQAATLPTWEREQHASRALSRDGSRVYFHSHEQLVTRDANGQVADVYQWEEQGTGSCERPGGCISLISTGTSPEVSEFLDASAGGNDVFFTTSARIDPRDEASIDVYDARVGGGFAAPAPAPECVGDACQPVPEPPRRPTPAGAIFSGPANPKPNRCRRLGRRAAGLSQRARRARRNAARARSQRRSRALRGRSVRLARGAKALSKRAKRCRHARGKGGSR